MLPTSTRTLKPYHAVVNSLQAFQQHCEYVRTPRGVVLQPMASLGLGKWLVIFCDEINLPSQVRFCRHSCATHRMLSFLRSIAMPRGLVYSALEVYQSTSIPCKS